jgi:hypothetical protein
MLVCPRCRRANPDEAEFCYYDGAELRPSDGRRAPVTLPGQLTRPFVFPSGRRCHSFDEFAQACQSEWAAARDILRRGGFRAFLESVGRMDLARLAQEAMAQPDPDAALSSFLDGLPVLRSRTPQLDLMPRRLNLGTLYQGESREVPLTIVNQGEGVLQGTMTLAEGTIGEHHWLSVVGGGGKTQCHLYAPRQQHVMLKVDASGLPAGQTYGGKLTVITNGGVAEVPVRMEVGARPFPRPPFEGAHTPRELAERMKRRPHEAADVLEAGEVERWFASNGWYYPVQGPTAHGVGAVQQFFEAMGWTRPPAVRISEPEVRMAPYQPEVIRWEVTLYTDAKKWVYGHVESDSTWLKVLTPSVSGARRADILFEVDSGLLTAEQTYVGHVTVRANGGQVETVIVRVDVQKGETPFTERLLGPFLSGVLLALAVGSPLGPPDCPLALGRAADAINTSLLGPFARVAHG